MQGKENMPRTAAIEEKKYKDKIEELKRSDKRLSLF